MYQEKKHFDKHALQPSSYGCRSAAREGKVRDVEFQIIQSKIGILESITSRDRFTNNGAFPLKPSCKNNAIIKEMKQRQQEFHFHIEVNTSS